MDFFWHMGHFFLFRPGVVSRALGHDARRRPALTHGSKEIGPPAEVRGAVAKIGKKPRGSVSAEEPEPARTTANATI